MNRILVVIALCVAAVFFGLFIYFKNNPAPISFLPIVGERSVDLLFVGDIMLDRGVRNAINREGADYPFRDIRELLTSADISVGNLEGVFTDNPSISVVDNKVLRFTFDPALVSMLKDFGFSGFSLANNHAWDFGRSGFENTKTILNQNGFFSFGSPSNNIDLSARLSVKEEEFCFVGYHSLYQEDTSPVISEIKAIRDSCSYLVVFAHWGEEYKDEENLGQRRQGRSFIDAGADLVVGHHPHVVQPVEIYKGAAIFYSLGNFLFDQDFSLPTRQGLAVRLTLSENEQSFHLIPVEMSRARLYYPEHEGFQARRDVLISKLPEPLRSEASIDSSFSLPRLVK